MKGKRILTSLLALATGCVCLFTTACADLDGLLGNGNGSGNGGGHTHTSYGYEDFSDTQHRKYCTDPDCDYSILEDHNYTDASDTTCNNCDHVRTIDDGNGGGGGQTHEHKFTYELGDADGHYKTCTTCNDVTHVYEAHVYENGGTVCKYCQYQKVTEQPSTNLLTYKHQGYESAAFEWSDTNAKNAKVEYRLNGSTAYTQIDKDLIRQIDANTARADVLGLKANTLYDFKVTASSGKSETVESVKIEGYDRKGSYAHFNYTSGVGAYKDDGTLKSNAVVVYVDENNKNTVKATIDGKTYTGIVNILNGATSDTPLVVRIIGTVGAATWKKLEYKDKWDEDGHITPDKVTGKDGTTKLVEKYKVNRSTYNPSTKTYEGGESKDIYQATLIADGINELDTKNGTLLELEGLNSKIKYDKSKDEFDSCWNDCSVKNVKNVTVEGVGDGAKIFQWGFTFKNSSSIEVRNLTFDDNPEDACSFEADETSAKSLSEFKSGNVWVHNNTFEEGVNYWDVCNEQDKNDGDGSTDFKGLKNITISYNVYVETHKTGLIGGGDSHTTANVTFHHNWYKSCKARLPLGRQANMHMYNNYYDGTTDTSISLRGNAYAFIENCYFKAASKNTKNIELQKGSAGVGSAKVVNCTFEGAGYIKNDAGSDYYSEGTDRLATIKKSVNTFAPNFDTNSSLFYYKNGKSDVGTMLDASSVPDYVKANAGVSKRNNNMKGGDTLDPEEPDTPSTNPVPTLTVNANDLPSSFKSVATDSDTEVTQAIVFGSSMFALEPGTGNNKWKLYTNNNTLTVPYLQSNGAGTITIDLTNYTGSAKLEIVARTPGDNEGRYYTITNGQGYSERTSDFTNKDRTDTFTLECGYKYTLSCSGGLRFLSFKIYAV